MAASTNAGTRNHQNHGVTGKRLARTRWPEKEPVDDWSMGIPLAYVQELAGYWAKSYEMRRVAGRLNRYEQFMTTIDGVDIHFLQVRSPVQGATPCVMTHGWPGSVIEFIKVIDPLVDPVGHGGEASDALELVIPSLPARGGHFAAYEAPAEFVAEVRAGPRALVCESIRA